MDPNGVKMVGQMLATLFDRRLPHEWDTEDYCINCKQYKEQLGNLFSCSGGKRKGMIFGERTHQTWKGRKEQMPQP